MKNLECDLFSDFLYDFRSSQSTAGHLTVLSDRIAKAFSWVLTGFGMLVFFTNLSLMEFQFRHLVLFPLSSVIDSFGWSWMRSLHKNIQLMLEFLKALFLVLHFSYYTLIMTFMMLSVILISMLMISHLICGNNYNWLLNLNLIYETLWTEAGTGLLISILEKLDSFHLTEILGRSFLRVELLFCTLWTKRRNFICSQIIAQSYSFLLSIEQIFIPKNR